MSNEVTWSIHPGQVKISEDGVWQIIDHDDVKVWEIDLVSKYPDVIGGICHEPDDVTTYEAWIAASEDTLRVDRSTEKTTVLKIHGLDDSWHLMTNGSRYTVRVVVFRYPERETVD